MSTRDVRVRLEPDTDRFPDGKIVSWENISVVKYPSIYEKAKSTICCKEKDKYKKTLLNKISGIVYPGEMVALMGASGSGKTTLLNAITFKISSDLKRSGKVMINGAQVDSHAMSSRSSFVQQNDLFFGTMTMREHLTLQAMLRMGGRWEKQDILDRVEELLERFQLKEKADSVQIGIPGVKKGISGGQMRRLAFASEVLTKPSILFCDEPTSGLDFNMANSLVNFLREEADEGKTIICTIHQPSSKIFNVFDKVCLLAQGEQAFFGTISDARAFFIRKLGINIPADSNPADVYIEALGIDPDPAKEAQSKEIIMGYCQTFRTSELNKQIDSKIKRSKIRSDPSSESVPKNYTPYSNRFFKEFWYLLCRGFLNYRRNHKAFLIDLSMAILTAMLGGTIYFQSAEVDENGECVFDQNVASNIATALFYVVTVVSIISVLSAVLAFPLEIPIYLRENYAYIYRCESYYLSKFILEIPIYIFFPTINGTIIYFVAKFGCGADNYAFFLFIVILIAQSSFALGHVLSILGSSVTESISLAAPAIAFQMLFSGFFLKKAETSPEWIKSLKFISVFNYGFDLLMINQWEKVEKLNCPIPTIPPISFNVTETTLSALESTTTELIDQTLNDFSQNSFYRATNERPFYCMENGAEILDDLRIRPKNTWFYIFMLFVLLFSFRLLAFLILKLKSKNYKRPKRRLHRF